MLNRMINQLKEELNFDFNNPSYKKLDEELSNSVRAIYQLYANQCNLEKNRPIYSSNGTLIANGFDRIVIGDYGPYIEFTKEQANEKESVDFYKSIKDAFILEAFANEYGDHACFRYNKVTYKGYRKNHDIDSTSFIDQYIYSYEDEEYIE